MWRLYQTSRATRSRPSELCYVIDRWAAYQFDNAVMYFGMVIENAAQEQIKVGPEDKPRWEKKYTLAQLLTPGFVIADDTDDKEPLPLDAQGLIYDEVD